MLTKKCLQVEGLSSELFVEWYESLDSKIAAIKDFKDKHDSLRSRKFVHNRTEL